MGYFQKIILAGILMGGIVPVAQANLFLAEIDIDSYKITMFPKLYHFMQEEKAYNQQLRLFDKVIQHPHHVNNKQLDSDITVKKDPDGNVAIRLVWEHLSGHTPGQFWREDYHDRCFNYPGSYQFLSSLEAEYPLSCGNTHRDYDHGNKSMGFHNMYGINVDYHPHSITVVYNTDVAGLQHMHEQARQIIRALIKYEKRTKTSIGTRQLQDFVPNLFPKMIYPSFRPAKSGFVIRRTTYGHYFLTVTLDKPICQLARKSTMLPDCSVNHQVWYSFHNERERMTIENADS